MSIVNVVKLGGSLLDLPDLPERLNRYLSQRARAEPSKTKKDIVIVIGGGASADSIRQYDQQHSLKAHQAHWLAVSSMQFNAWCVACLLGQQELAEDLSACRKQWAKRRPAVIDPVAWLHRLEQQGIDIPYRWSYTSDSIAALLAVHFKATSLTLLKSTLPPQACSRQKAVELGLVDADFPITSQSLDRVEWVNLREDDFPTVRAVES